MVSALIEGLAGVVDLSAGFQEVELSPRWLVTGLKQANVRIAYPASKKMLEYSWKYDPGKRQISLQTHGDARMLRVRMLLPRQVANKAVAEVNQKRVPARLEWVRQSPYLVFHAPGKATIRVKW